MVVPSTEMGWRKDDGFCGESAHTDSELPDNWRCLMAKQKRGCRFERAVWSDLPGSEIESFGTVLSIRSLLQTTCVMFRFLVAAVKK